MAIRWRFEITPTIERSVAWAVAVGILVWQTVIEDTAQPSLVTAAVTIILYPLVASRDRKDRDAKDLDA